MLPQAGVVVGLVLSLLLQGWPAAGWAVGGSHGAPHTTRPKTPSHDGGTAPGAAHNRPAHGPDWVDPPVLRDAARAGRDAQPGAHPAGGEPVARPFVTAPHIEVQLTGDPATDALHLDLLRAEISGRVDPDRVRLLSLADDALSDSRLAAGLGADGVGPQMAVEAGLRRLQGDADVPMLARVLHRLRGDVLLLVAHHEPDGTVVFTGRNGRPVRAAAGVLQQAAQEAGVHLQLLGCHSARWSAAGYRDALNSLDAVDALLRVHRNRPQTWLDLMASLSGPDQLLGIDAARWQVQREARVIGPDGATPLSGFHWYGPRVPATSLAPVLPPAQADASTADKTTTSGWLALAVMLSLVAGGMLAPWALPLGADARRWSLRDALLHALALAVWAGVWSRAVVGSGAMSWAVAGLLITLAGVATAAWQVLRARGSVLLRLLQFARALALTAPLGLLVLMHGSAWRPPTAILAGMRALHAWALDQRDLKSLVVLAVLLALAGLPVAVMAAVAGSASFDRLHPWRHAAHWRRTLAATGVASGWRRWAAARSRVHLESAVWRRTGSQPAWAQLQVVSSFVATDPWRGDAVCSWQLVKLPLVRQAEAFALVREGHPFVHGLPELLARRHLSGQLPSTELPTLLAAREWWLRGTDFVPAGQGLAPFMAGLLIAFAAWTATIDAWVLPDYQRGELLGLAGVLVAVSAWPLLLIGRRVLHRMLLQRAGGGHGRPVPASAR